MFILHNGNRIEILAQKLSEVMAGYEAPPLLPRTIVVNNPGMARWLSFKLASIDSICANVNFPMPAAFIGQITKRLLPEEGHYPALDREQLSWLILGALPRWLPSTSVMLPGHLRIIADSRPGEASKELYGLAQRLGQLFEKYLTYRPDMLLAWEQGDDSSVVPLRKEDRWQPSLWRFVTTSFKYSHRARLLKNLTDMLDHPLVDTMFPCPVALFGISHLPPVYLELFFQLAKHIDVHLFVLNPCSTFWEDIKSPKRKKKMEYLVGHDPLTSFHPLLESLGTVGKDFLHALYERLFEPGIESDAKDYFHIPQGGSLLSWLQAGILRGEELKRPAFEMTADDHSIQIHSCHSPLREVEVLHDQLLDMFENLSDLHPHEVLVMAPDIQKYAPFIEAVFGAHPTDSKRTIPWAITDLPEDKRNPLITTFLKILDLSNLPVTAPALMDILEYPCTARRFGLDEEGLDLVRELVAESGIRRELGFDEARQNSWRFGLDRLLGSYSYSGKSLLWSILPFETPVEGDIARAVGCLSFFVSKIRSFLDETSKERSPMEWQELIVNLVETFFLPEEPDEKQAVVLIMDTAAHLRDLSEQAHIEFLDLEIVRQFLHDRLNRPAGARNFISGKVTFSSLVPMRSIPARIICLLGMNDTDFPRRRPATNFDLVERHPRPGDKFPRDEDRYLFLETILSARDCLYISYVGRSQKDNTLMLPSGVISELLDFLEQNIQGPNGEGIHKNLVTEHPLMPFSAAYSRQEQPRLFTYADEWCRPRCDEKDGQDTYWITPFWGEEIDMGQEDPDRIELSQLVYFFSHPARFFLSKRLGIDLAFQNAVLLADEPFSFSALDHYMQTNEIIQLLMDRGKQALEEQYLRLRGKGLLPFPPFDQLSFGQIVNSAIKILPHLERVGIHSSASAVDIHIGDIRLTGSIWTSKQHGAVSFRAAKIKASDRVSLWIKHLVATLNTGHEVESIHVGSDGHSIELAGLDQNEANDCLSKLLDIFLQGIKRPLPFIPEPSFVFAKNYLTLMNKHDEGTAISKATALAEKQFQKGTYRNGKSLHDRWLEVAFRGRRVFDREFQELALSVFEPLIEKSKEKRT